MFQLQRLPGQKFIELGGGDKPVVHPKVMGGDDINIDVRVCYNQEGKQTVDFACSFEEPLPLTTEEFDGLVSVFALEHITWRKISQVMSEMFRVLKPNTKVFLILPNTEAQMQYILNKIEWDGDEGSMLFGDLNYPENGHKSAWSPRWVTKLLQEVGFENILVEPFGQLQTDMLVQAVKPIGKATSLSTSESVEKQVVQSVLTPTIQQSPRIQLYNRDYFNNYKGGSFYWDYPHHELIARRILERKPESVLELGAGRGYILKRLQDADIPAWGIDVSKHCQMTKVCEGISQINVLEGNWFSSSEEQLDFCFSFAFWEHIHESDLYKVIGEMERHTKRGLHAITFVGENDGVDLNRCTLQTREWWRQRLPTTHEVVSTRELASGEITEDYLRGDGRLKLNLGSCWTCFHHGWLNVDILDLTQFANQHRYKFQHLDIRQGLPYGTGVVDLIFMSHVFEHLDYKEALTFLREARRVIRLDGAMRLSMPNAELLMGYYSGRKFNLEAGYEDGQEYSLTQFDEVNEGCANSPTLAGKLWSLLHEGHKACYDEETLMKLLDEAGWVGHPTILRQTKTGHSGIKQIFKETTEMDYGLSLICDCLPKLA